MGEIIMGSKPNNEFEVTGIGSSANGGGGSENSFQIIEGTPEYHNYTYTGRMSITSEELERIANGIPTVFKINRPDNDDSSNALTFPWTINVMGSSNLLGNDPSRARRIFLFSEPKIFSNQTSYCTDIESENGELYLKFYADYS